MLAWIAGGERLERFDEPFARVVREARGHDPIARAPLSETVGDRYWTVLRAAIDRARTRGTARSMLHGFGPEGRSLDVTLTADSASGEIELSLAPLDDADATDEASFASALHGNLTEMIAVFDRDLRLRGFNAAYAAGARAVLGRDLVVGDTFREVMHADSVPRWDALCRRALAGESFIEDFVVELAIGLVHTYEVSLNPVRDPKGDVVGGVMVSRNVTERRRGESDAHAIAEQRRAILEAVPDAITMMTRDGTITSYKAARSDVPAARVGAHIRDLPDEPGSRITTLLEPVFTSGEPIRVEYESVVGGVLRHHTGWLHRINDREAIWLARDVTEEKTAALRLAYTDRMASIGTLAAGVAHEINNPLQYVLTNLELAEERLATVAPDVRELVLESLEGVRRVCGVVASLRAFSTNQDVAPGVVDVADAARGALALATRRIESVARLEIDLAAGGKIVAARNHLEQTFLALLLNAADALDEERTDTNVITVRSRRLDERRVMVEVVDNGRGMSPSVRPRIFDPFFTTKPIGQGTGLGLTVALHVVRAAGGTIDVESTPGEGTTMRVVLPLASSEPPPKG